MDSTQGFLQTVIARVRGYLDEPDTDAKFTDDFITRHCIGSALQDVYSRAHLNADNPILCTWTFDIEPDVVEYQLPPCIGELWEIVTRDDHGRIILDAVPRSHFNPSGPGYEIQGNLLVLGRSEPREVTDVQVTYIHNGDIRCHFSVTGELDDNAGTHRMILGTPTYGEIDRRVNGYAGQILRVIPATGPIEERVIERSYYESSNWYVDLRLPLTETTVPSADNNVVYEIVPPMHESFVEAVSAAVALRLGTYRGISQAKMGAIEREYRKSMKTVKDAVAFMQMRVPKRFQKDTRDNPEAGKYQPFTLL